MKRMMKLICVSALMVLVGACNLLEMNKTLDRSRSDSGRDRDSTSNADTSAGKKTTYDTIVYAAGIRYPDNYNWQIDTLAEKQKGELVLLKDGEVQVALPVGFENSISADPDMHRIADGHLYTDFSSGLQTIIKCDGKELFRYAGREFLRGFAVMDGDIWTLGEDRSHDTGVFLRKNGALVFQDPDGVVVGSLSDTGNPYGALSFDGSTPVFFYTYMAQGALSRSLHCVMVRGSEPSDLNLPKNFTRIYDAKFIKGEPVAVGQISAMRNTLSTYQGNMVTGITMHDVDRISNCRIMTDSEGETVFSGECYASGVLAGFICDTRGQNRFYDLKGRLIGLYTNKSKEVILSCGEAGAGPIITSNGISTIYPGKYLYISTRCGFLCGDTFFLGMNPEAEGSPFILKDRARTELGYNGFVTEVWAEIIQREKQ